MKKLILEEDEITVQDNQIDLSNTALITNLIRNTWDSIDLFNSVNLTLEDNGDQKVVDIVNDIISSLYINIGQLESALQQVNSQAEVIDDAKDNDDLLDLIVPEEKIEIEEE